MTRNGVNRSSPWLQGSDREERLLGGRGFSWRPEQPDGVRQEMRAEEEAFQQKENVREES